MNQVNNILQTKQVLIWAIATAMICLGLIAFVIYPQTLSFLENQTQIETFQARLNSLNKKSSDLEKINLDEYRRLLTISLFALPEESDAITAISQLNAMATGNQLQVASISFTGASASTPGVSLPGIGSLELRSEMVGSLQDIRKFSITLQQSEILLKLKGLETTYDKRTGLYRASVSVNAFFRPLPQALGEVDQPVVLLTKEDRDLLSKLEPEFSSETGVEIVEQTEAVGRPDPFQ